MGKAYENGVNYELDMENAIEWYQLAADQNHAGALFKLGELYFDRVDGLVDKLRSIDLWVRAFEQGYKYKGVSYSLWPAWGKSSKIPFKIKLVGIIKSAVEGDCDSQYDLSIILFEGQHGIPIDKCKAFEWSKRAADQHHIVAQRNLAWSYWNGEGTNKDKFEAFKWWTQAANQGDVDAMSWLGYTNMHGEGTLKNESEAVEWYRKAAKKGNSISQTELGLAFRNGNGVVRDEREEIFWLRKAAENGYAKAQFLLSMSLGLTKDNYEALDWCRKAARQEYKDALVMLEVLGLQS